MKVSNPAGGPRCSSQRDTGKWAPADRERVAVSLLGLPLPGWMNPGWRRQEHGGDHACQGGPKRLKQGGIGSGQQTQERWCGPRRRIPKVKFYKVSQRAFLIPDLLELLGRDTVPIWVHRGPTMTPSNLYQKQQSSQRTSTPTVPCQSKSPADGVRTGRNPIAVHTQLCDLGRPFISSARCSSARQDLP